MDEELRSPAPFDRTDRMSIYGHIHNMLSLTIGAPYQSIIHNTWRTHPKLGRHLEPKYLQMPGKLASPVDNQKLIANFRALCTSLNAHNYLLPTRDRICAYCATKRLRVIEDEFHMIIECPLYHAPRTKYLDYLIKV